MNKSHQNPELLADVEILKRAGIIKKDSRIAESTGYSRGQVSNYLNGRIKASDNFLDAFYKVYGEKLKENKVFAPTVMQQKGNITHVPLHAFGGFLIGSHDPLFTDSLEHYRLPGITGNHFSFEVEGMSMYRGGDEKSMKPGDWVICKEVERIEYMSKGKAYVLATTEGIIVKIFDSIDDKKARFISLNSDYDACVIPLKSVKRIYFVVHILKKTT